MCKDNGVTGHCCLFFVGLCPTTCKMVVVYMKKSHSIKSKIVLLAIVPMLLISVILLVYAFVGGIMNTNSALTDSMSETAKISAQAITN